MAETQHNRLSHWLPIIQRVLPSHRFPKTEIVRTDCDLLHLLDGKEPEGFGAFLKDLEEAALRCGPYPVFLRHDLSSAKHSWKDTCFVADPKDLASHVAYAVDDWFAANWFAGLEDVNTWVAREYIPVDPVVMTAFREMPIGPERRYVVRDGEVIDHFPYWPLRAFWQPEPDIFEGVIPDTTPPADLVCQVASISRESLEEVAELTPLAEAAGRALGGEWTVDFMHTARGWLLIDCAVLKDSWLPDQQDRDDWRVA